MTQLVKCPTLDFGSGHDLVVREIEPSVEPRVRPHMEHGPCLGFSLCPCPACTDRMELAWGFLSPSLSIPPSLSLPFFVKIIINLKKKENPMEAIKNLLNIINVFSKVARYKINIQKSIIFPYTCDEQCGMKLRKQLH